MDVEGYGRSGRDGAHPIVLRAGAYVCGEAVCRRLCWFCACRTQGTRNDEPLDRCLDHLACEIVESWARLPGGVGVSSLHLGGRDADALVAGADRPAGGDAGRGVSRR